MDLLTPNWDYDKSQSFTGSSRYEGYLQTCRPLAEAFDWWNAGQHLYALTAWQSTALIMAQPPIMSPGLVSRHPLLRDPVRLGFDKETKKAAAVVSLVLPSHGLRLPDVQGWETAMTNGVTRWRAPSRSSWAVASLEVNLPLDWDQTACIPAHPADAGAASRVVGEVASLCNAAFAEMLSQLEQQACIAN